MAQRISHVRERVEKTCHYFLIIILAVAVCSGLCLALTDQAQAQYVVIKAAFHIHTTYSGGNLAPSQVVDLYQRYGFNCVSITDYNSVSGSFAGVAEAMARGKQTGVIVIGGQEIISQFPLNNGRVVFKHMLALFLSQPILNPSQTYRANNVQYYFDAIHNQGGIGIVAHSWDMNDQTVTGTSSSPWWPFRNSSYVDGWEIFNYGVIGNGMTDDEIYNVLGRGKIALASHDFHKSSITNTLYNVLFCHNATEEGVKDALINQRMVAYNRNRVFGTREAMNLYQRYTGSLTRIPYP